MKYYLNGDQVGYKQAFLFFQNKAMSKGVPQVDAWAYWCMRDREDGRVTIFDLSDRQVEIIAE